MPYFSIVSIENAERVEHCPWKLMFVYWKMAIYFSIWGTIGAGSTVRLECGWNTSALRRRMALRSCATASSSVTTKRWGICWSIKRQHVLLICSHSLLLYNRRIWSSRRFRQCSKRSACRWAAAAVSWDGFLRRFLEAVSWGGFLRRFLDSKWWWIADLKSWNFY